MLPGQASTTQLNQNEGAAELKGVDFDITARVIDGLTVTLATAYVHTELTEASLNGGANEGKELIFVSPWSGTLSVDYQYALENGWMATFHIDHSRFSRQWFNVTNTIAIPKYHLSNARFAVREASDKWRATLWVKNLTDETIVRDRYSDLTFFADNDAASAATFGTYQYIDPPRSFGVELTWNLN